MKKKTNSIVMNLAFAGGLLLCRAGSGLTCSGQQPGETVGAPSGASAPPGFYFANKANWGCRNTSQEGRCVCIDIPVLAWSTPWTIFGARLQLFSAGIIPVEVGVHNTTYFSGLFNPFASAQLAWDLGNGWGFSYLLGGYFDVSSPVAYSSNSLNQRFPLSYTNNRWDLTANVISVIQLDQRDSRAQTAPCPVSPAFPSNGPSPNFINVSPTPTNKLTNRESH